MKTLIFSIVLAVSALVYLDIIYPRINPPVEVGQIRIQRVDDMFKGDMRIKILEIRGKYVKYVFWNKHINAFTPEQYASSDRVSYIRHAFDEVEP